MGHGRRAPRHPEPGDAVRASWVSFRQPVLRAARERLGETFRYTYEANPGEVWEEDEFWIELSLADRSRRRARHPQAGSSRPTGRARSSPSTSTTAGSSRTPCPACPRRPRAKGLTPLEYMRRYGAFLIEKDVTACRRSRWPSRPAPCAIRRPARGRGRQGGGAGGRRRGGGRLPDAVAALEIYSRTLEEWGWPEEALPGYIRSHVHRDATGRARRARWCCFPTFRLPTLIHTRSGNAKYLNEISHRNPLWVHTERRAPPGARARATSCG